MSEPTPDELRARIAEIERRLDSGVTQTREGDRQVNRDLAALRIRRDELVGQLRRAEQTPAHPRRFRPIICKGL